MSKIKSKGKNYFRRKKKPAKPNKTQASHESLKKLAEHFNNYRYN